MDVEKNCELLFKYLKSILYDKKVESLDLDLVDEPFKKLGEGLQFLEHCVTELQQCSADLSKGDLAHFHPSRDNFLCSNLKNIHANLEHLTWQAKQVAKGDYSQHVSYMGEFSEAFNLMIEQLKEREQALKKESEMLKSHSDFVEKYNHLLLELIHHSKDDVVVSDVEMKEILYASHNFLNTKIETELLSQFTQRLSEEKRKEEWQWEMMDSSHRFYHVVSVLTEWNQERAFAHFIRDITDEKAEEEKLREEAYFDSLTHIGNRNYFMHHMDEILKKDEEFVFCYCDLDELKYVNDTFGHLRGDQYICDFVKCVKKYIRDYDLFARVGGDEFCIVFVNCSLESATKKMNYIQKQFEKESGDVENQFSYGNVYLKHAHEDLNVEDLMREADYVMYQQKREHRRIRK